MGSTLLIVETIVAGLLLGAIWSHTSVAGSEPNRQLARNALVCDEKTEANVPVQIVHETIHHQQQLIQQDQLGSRKPKIHTVDCKTLCGADGLCQSPEFYECISRQWKSEKYGLSGKEKAAFDAYGRQTVYNQLKQKW